MEEILAVEQRRRETPLEKLFRDSGSFSAALLRLAVLTAILTPIILASFLTLDLAVFRFDQIFDAAAQKPSNWLSVGGLVMVGAGLLVILFSRRFGGDEAARAITAAWGVTAIAAFAGLAELSPVLQDSDFPTVRTVVAFVASAMIGQYVAVSFYDVVRGGGRFGVYAATAAFLRSFGASFDVIIDEINTRPVFAHHHCQRTPVVAFAHQVAREVWHHEMPWPVALAGRYVLEPQWLRAYADVPTLTVSASSAESLAEYGLRRLEVLPEGRLFLRHLAMAFDAYLARLRPEGAQAGSGARFSQTL